jgi:hypothetical protein
MIRIRESALPLDQRSPLEVSDRTMHKMTSRFGLIAAAVLMATLRASAAGQLTGSSRFQPGSDQVIARITRQIDPLIALLPAANPAQPDAMIDALVKADARTQLFRLESLLRLYRHKFPNLKEHLRQVKALEDGLGAYSYAVDSVTFATDKFKKDNQAKAPTAAQQAEQQQVVDGLKKKQAAAHDVLTKELAKSTLGTDLRSLRSQVPARLRGWGTAEDVPFVKRELTQMLKEVRDGKFDFNKLEDGIHEYRRQLRWFPITVDALDGTIVARDGSCPVPALESLAGSAAARNKYANPSSKFPAARPCTVSRCLLWQVSKTVRDIGRLKDVAQGNAAVEAALDEDLDVSSSNKATPEETAQAKTLRAEMNSTHALDSLMSQIASCKP